MQLSKYLSQAGACSRREAAQLIKDGHVTINGTVITEPWREVPEGHVVKANNKVVRLEQKIYVALNKPKGYISTVRDEHGRKTVLELVKTEIKQRLYPIGRLDFDTTGLLLLTNDGELAQKLAHPKYRIKKVYRAILDRPLTSADAQTIRAGIKLPDGPVIVDALEYSPRSKSVSVTLHSGKYRVIKRIFARVGYHVIALERTQFAHLSVRGMPLGSWKMLSTSEITRLKKEKSPKK